MFKINTISINKLYKQFVLIELTFNIKVSLNDIILF